MIRRYVAVIEILGYADLRSPEYSYPLAMEWIEVKRKIYAPQFKTRPWKIWLESQSLMEKQYKSIVGKPRRILTSKTQTNEYQI